MRLPCRVEFSGGSLSAQVIDLSQAGARIELPVAGNTEDFWGITSIQVDGIGYLAVEVRWQSGNIIGMAFRTSEAKVQDYIDKL